MNAVAKTQGFTGIWGEISGLRVLMATKDGVVEVDSVRQSLDLDREDSLWPYLLSRQRAETVTIDGMPRTTYLVSLEAFFNYCMRNPSPKLDAYRDELARIARSVQQRGSYIDPGAGPKAYIPPGFENNKNMQMLAILMDQEAKVGQLAVAVAETKGDVAEIRQQIGRGPSAWTVAAWLSLHGVKLFKDEISHEGRILSGICKNRGFVVSEERVCNGGEFPARLWPREAINIWWPDFCRRMGAEVFWRV
jgi:hypothetical protein